MKKFVLVLLSVLLCLLLFSCEGDVVTSSSSEITSSEIASSVENTSSEPIDIDFLKSKEALDWVKNIASYMGYVSYSEIDTSNYPDIPIAFAHCLAEQLYEIDNNTNKDEKVTISELSDIFKKYFGEKATFKSANGKKDYDISSISASPDWTVADVKFKELVDNKAVYTIELNYQRLELSYYDYIAQMSFEVKNDSDKHYLVLASNEIFLKGEKEFTLEEKAEALASILAVCVHPRYEGKVSPENVNAGGLICEVLLYNNYEALPYAHSFERDFRLLYHFPTKTLNKIVFEVLGQDEFNFNNDNFTYIEESAEYVSYMEFGAADFKKDVDEVVTLPTSEIQVTVGKKIFTFKPMQDNDGNTFLRLV